MEDFPLANEFGSKFGRPAVFAGGTPKDDARRAVLNDSMRAAPIGVGDLGNGLESQANAGAEFSAARQGILEAVDLP
jgi:hypothetical protein